MWPCCISQLQNLHSLSVFCRKEHIDYWGLTTLHLPQFLVCIPWDLVVLASSGGQSRQRWGQMQENWINGNLCPCYEWELVSKGHVIMSIWIFSSHGDSYNLIVMHQMFICISGMCTYAEVCNGPLKRTEKLIPGAFPTQVTFLDI